MGIWLARYRQITVFCSIGELMEGWLMVILWLLFRCDKITAGNNNLCFVFRGGSTCFICLDVLYRTKNILQVRKSEYHGTYILKNNWGKINYIILLVLQFFLLWSWCVNRLLLWVKLIMLLGFLGDCFTSNSGFQNMCPGYQSLPTVDQLITYFRKWTWGTLVKKTRNMR